MEREAGERRKYPREQFLAAIEYSVQAAEGPFRVKCMSANISEAGGGFCVFSRIPLARDQHVVLHRSELPFRCRKAVVIWTVKMNENIHAAGLRCVDRKD